VGSRCVEFLRELVVEVRPQQASILGVLFLREQVRDLRVQEFLRELVVGITTLNDLA